MFKKLLLATLLVFSSVLAELDPPPPPDYDQCSIVDDNARFDCFPQANPNQQDCEARGCCWIPVDRRNLRAPLDTPYCFFPPNYLSYNFLNVSQTDNGLVAFLSRNASSAVYQNDVEVIQLTVIFETENRLHFKFTDPSEERFESPYPVTEDVSEIPSDFAYVFNIEQYGTSFQIIRQSDDTVIFDTSVANNFIYSDQFLQLSSKLPSSYIYGLGEHRNPFLLPTSWSGFTFMNHDRVPDLNANVYGTHPFYLVMEESGNAHGVFLKNSNPMDAILQPTPAITFRTIGGILDFYVFLGPTPADVTKQYVELIGKPYMPPYWGLGFHLCRYGYQTLDNTKAIMQRNIDAGIPLDTQWNDLDYMESNNGFTYNKDTFAGLPEFVKELHDNGMHFIPIVDPGVSGSEEEGTYPAFDLGKEMDIFVKDYKGDIFVGKVWNPESTVWPDFTHPNATDYWYEMLKAMHDEFEFDGAWIDMNEPSNFLDGSPDGCPDSNLEHPVYVPNVDGGVLYYRTVCMTAQQYAGLHYNVHNLFGISEAEVTNKALTKLRNKRPMIISRSSFAGHGHYAGHWSGDIASDWSEMKYTIPELLSFSLFGVPLMGADICGFRGNSNEALCNRWHQLGAFYPFSRNHNELGTVDQDPVAFGDQVVAATKKALIVRYHLLPYLYTLFWRAHVDAETVVRPLLFEFPGDVNTYSVDTQFLWGPALLICPVLEDGALEVSIYLPEGIWYDYYTLAPIQSEGSEMTLDAPIDTIPLLVRGGFILPQQVPAQTTTASRLNKIELLVAPDENRQASGELYWDDGDSPDSYENELYSLIQFKLDQNTITSENVFWSDEHPPNLGAVTVSGVEDAVTRVTVNGAEAQFSHDTVNKALIVDNLDVDLSSPMTITWR